MAGIDTLWLCSWKDYKDLSAWINDQDVPDLIEGLWSYTENDLKNCANSFPALTTSERMDRYLANRCPLIFVQDKLIDSYSLSWIKRYPALYMRIKNRHKTIKRGGR